METIVHSIKGLFMASSLKYPVGIQSFSSLREGGYAYVDKTQYIYSLLNSGKYFFLSRPRRFGKSLFLSTLEAYFKGERDLFKGLAIDKYETDWIVRPIIQLSFNTIDFQIADALRKHLSSVFNEYEDQYGIKQTDEELSRRFEILIKTAYESCRMIEIISYPILQKQLPKKGVRSVEI